MNPRACPSCGSHFCDSVQCFLDEPSEQPDLIELERMRKAERERKVA